MFSFERFHLNSCPPYQPATNDRVSCPGKLSLESVGAGIAGIPICIVQVCRATKKNKQAAIIWGEVLLAHGFPGHNELPDLLKDYTPLEILHGGQGRYSRAEDGWGV